MSEQKPPEAGAAPTPPEAAPSGAGAPPQAPSPSGAGAPPPTPVAPTTTGGGGGTSSTGIVALVVAIGVVIVIVALFLLNQGGDGGATPEPSATPAASAEPSAEPSEEPQPTATPDACAPENLALITAGQLTAGTDNPAYPPYFEPGDGPFTEPWEDLGFTGDPGSGKGFESAVAYAVAEQLGFSADQISWVVVPFANAFAPGPKNFDFVINQVSYKPERAQNVDMSEGYYFLNQAIVALKENPASGATSLADLKDVRFGAQVGTTSYDAIINVIDPTTETSLYDTNDAAIEALKAKQIDAIVVDLPTSDFITNVQIEDGAATIVGQLEPAGGEPEYFSLVLGKGSALTECVNKAVVALRDDGTLDALASEWLPFQDSVPVLK
jgi:polar amino acid transport system substrate-binding protein